MAEMYYNPVRTRQPLSVKKLIYSLGDRVKFRGASLAGDKDIHSWAINWQADIARTTKYGNPNRR
jgi:hypothetical protein